ncbi:MAG TPA: oligosaccharide flippase family protein [Sphingomonas sp.]|uniref:oligosaccharide flippase family protein n=1 Tax=Sphingomonas sp. TaxID=28214 RepID=UPI002C4CE7F9|nr:oligosaccharide flippase family protein [Sphingomonas sp.]HMI18584.1 oligosaccharide flippase family protein [Sphingomonas sp.]
MPVARGLSVQRLRQLATGGAASIAMSVAVTNVLRIVSSMTLTRLLDSHAYGVVGVITSITVVLAMLSDIGLLGFIVRHKDGDDPTFLDQIWTLRALRGLGLTIAMAVLAKPAAILLGKPELTPVIAVWSLSFLLDGLSSLAFATAIRNQQLWRLSSLDLASNVMMLLVSISFALVWPNYWAMIAGMGAGAILKLILSYVLFPATRRRFHFHRGRSRELWQFSRFIALSSMLSLLILQSDKLVLARLMPLSAFGLYAIAVTLSSAPGSLASPYATRILYPIYARIAREAPDALRGTYYRARRNFSLLYMFAVGGMLGSAPLIIAILYDPRYRGVAPFLELITISAVLRMSSLAANEVMVATGRMNVTFLANVFRVAWLAIGGGIGLWTGNIMLLVAMVGTTELPGMICYWWFLHRAHLLDLREEAYGLAAGGTGAGLGWLLAMTVLHLFPGL